MSGPDEDQEEPRVELPDLGQTPPEAPPKLALYRTLVNLNGIGAGVWIEIDPEEPGWVQAVEDGHIVADADWTGKRPPEYQ